MEKNEKLYNLSTFAGKVSEEVGKSIHAAWVSKYMREIDPPRGERYTPRKKFTNDQVNMFILFAKEVHQKKGEHSFKQWIQSHNFSIPEPYIEKSLLVKHSKHKSKNTDFEKRLKNLEERTNRNEAKLETVQRTVDEKAEEMEGFRQLLNGNISQKQIESNNYAKTRVIEECIYGEDGTLNKYDISEHNFWNNIISAYGKINRRELPKHVHNKNTFVSHIDKEKEWENIYTYYERYESEILSILLRHTNNNKQKEFSMGNAI